jgi:hypothetical protein
MNSTLNSVLQNSPVPQDSQLLSDMDLWEPPFERWMHLVDSLLGNVPVPVCKTLPKPQTLAPLQRS